MMKQFSTAAVAGLKLSTGIISAAMLIACGAPAGTPTGAGATGTPGTTTTGTGGGVTPQSFFETTVYPTISSCGACHAPPGVSGAPIYLAKDAPGSYASIKMSPSVYKAEGSTIFTIGTAAKPHQGGPIPENVKSAFTQWLKLEFPGSGAGPGGTTSGTGGTGAPLPNKAYNELVEAFADCMNRGDWNQLMAQFPLVPTDDFGTCSSCHGEGNAGTFLNADPNITYDSIRTPPFVYRLVQPRFENGQLVGIDPSTRLIDKGLLNNEICFDKNKVVCHSTYTIPNDQQADLQNFQLKTINKIKGGVCSLPEP
jgi:cytochrome c553